MSEAADIILSAQNLRKAFKSPSGGAIEVLCGASFDILRGQSAALTGESGAGKTTLLNITAGLERADDGRVLWEGARIDNLSSSKQARLRARFMGFVFQSYCLVPELNALENVVLAHRIAGLYSSKSASAALQMLEKVGLKDRAKHLPQQLSGGEKQRVAIARALINAPRLIFADEPTGNLDENTAEGVMQLLLNLCKNEGASLLLITHNETFAARTELRMHLAHGVINPA